MQPTEPLILIVGGADTGRAPIATALLRRIAESSGYSLRIESSGVVGHDESPAESEARDALATLGIDLSEHRARSLDDDLAARAHILLAVDSGVARVLRARYPAAQSFSLGDLAGTTRDIPDPFRMQVGAWLRYAGEIEAMLKAGVPRLLELLNLPPAHSPERAPVAEAPRQAAAPEPVPPERLAAADRGERLLTFMAELPGVVDWPNARRQLEAELALLSEPASQGDLARPYTAIVQAMLALAAAPPRPEQLVTLRMRIARLRSPIDQAALDEISSRLSEFSSL